LGHGIQGPEFGDPETEDLRAAVDQAPVPEKEEYF